MKPPRCLLPIITVPFVLVVMLPILYVLVTPFGVDSPDGQGGGAFAFDKRHLVLARNSFGLAAGTTALCLFLGVSFAFLMCRTNLWARRFLGITYLIPVLIPPYIHAIAWSHQNLFLKRLFSADLCSVWGVVFVLTLAYFPFITLLTSTGLTSIDRNTEEASLLTHGRWKTLWRITLPLIAPHMLSGAVFVFILSMTNFGVPDILRVKVYPIEVFIQFSAFYDEGAATLCSLPLIAVGVVLVLLMRWHMKDRSYIQVWGGASSPITYQLGWMQVPAFAVCVILLLLSAGLPVGVLLRTAGPIVNYINVLETSTGQIAYSLLLACLGALGSLFLALIMAYVLERQGGKLALAIAFGALLPLAIPSITLGIGLIRVWNRPVVDMLYESSFIVIVGYIAHFIPFSFLTVASGMKQINPGAEEVAFLATSRWGKVMGRIVSPLLGRALVLGFFIVFVLSFGDLGTTLLVIPPGRETVPIKIYNLMHYGAESMVAALCLLLIGIILGLSGLFLFAQKRLTMR